MSVDPEALERGFNEYLSYIQDNCDENQEDYPSQAEIVGLRDAYLAGAQAERRQMVKFLSGFRKKLAQVQTCT